MEGEKNTYQPPEYRRDVLQIPRSPNGSLRITKQNNKDEWARLQALKNEQKNNGALTSPEEEKQLRTWSRIAREVNTVTLTGGPIYQTPEALLEACLNYFQWLEENPVPVGKTHVTKEGNVIRYEEFKMTPATLDGLCIHLKMTRYIWAYYYRRHKDYIPVVSWVESWMRNQKFIGASTGLMNANLIMRDLGLSEKVHAEVTGKDGGPIEHDVHSGTGSGRGMNLDVSELTAKEIKTLRNLLGKALRTKKEMEDGTGNPPGLNPGNP